MKEMVYPEPELENKISSDEAEVYVFPASFGQKRLWFLDQFEPGSPAYNIPSAFRLRGPLNLDLFLKAIHEIVERHESLRTTFDYLENETVQIIHPDLQLVIPVINLHSKPAEKRENEILSLASKEARTPFDLKKGPLARINILKVDSEDHVVLFTLHHIISDGWSMGVLVSEISALYAAYAQNQSSPLKELPLQYADYAEWQTDYMQGEVLQQQLDFWHKHLGANPPVLELPTDRPRPMTQSSVGDSVEITVSKELAASVKKTGQKQGATLFMTLLAAYKILLSRYSGQQNLSIGTPIANRTQGETEGLIGLFINTLVLHTDFHDTTTINQLLQQVRKTTLSAYENQDLPFEFLVDSLQTDRDMRYSPLFQVMFILQNAPGSVQQVSDLTMEMLDVNMGTSTFDLTLSAAESTVGLSITAEYNTDLFDRETIEHFLLNYRTLLQSMSTNPDLTIAEIPILPANDLQLLTQEWNSNPADFRGDAIIHQLIEEQVQKNPEAIALIAGEEQINYGQLNEQANLLAHYLIKNGAGPETRIGLSLERSANMIISLLGILKSGSAYVPLDPNYPLDRLDYIIRDSAISLLLTQDDMRKTYDQKACPVVCLDSDWAEIIKNQPSSNPLTQMEPDNSAYVIYTSGSTGLPKGVVITHRSVVNHNQAVSKIFDLQSDDRVLQFATINFDAAVEEIFPTLQNGATLVLRSKEILISGSELNQLIHKEKLTILDLPTAYWQQWINELSEMETEVPESLKLVILGGDKASAEHVYRWNRMGGENVRLLNTYGPTETTIISSSYEMTDPIQESGLMREMPIGRPIANTFVYILDKNLQPVPPGVPGELYIGGEGLARGYLNQASLTAENFIPDPFARTAGMRLYKSGDLVKYQVDGNIEFVGRVDFQVKIRGFRVEPGEIENILLDHPEINDTIVVVDNIDAGNKQLLAYCVLSGNEELSVNRIRNYLTERLPEYMIPSAFILLKEMPLTENGKINRKSLPKPNQDLVLESSATDYVEPRNETEEIIAQICSKVLGLEKMGVLHNFFELGGHSLLATQLISRINKQFNTEVPLRKIFELPTVAGLALATKEALQGTSAMEIPPIIPISRDQHLPLSFAQHRLWFLDQLEPNSPFYNLPETYRLHGPLNINLLKKSINEIIRRHEILRTIFLAEAGNPFQQIEKTYEFSPNLNDISLLTEKEKEAELIKITREKAFTPISLTDLPLFNLELVRLSEEDHAVILIMHHIISDNWSSQVLMGEMAHLYQSLLVGNPSPLPDLPIQYADFAYWQRNWLKDDILDQHLKYWRHHLSDAPPVLQMPTDRPRPASQTFNGDYIQFHIAADTSKLIKKIAQDQGTTLFMTLLAAFKVLLYRYSGQDDISIGTPIANRNNAEIEPLIGFFVNTLVMRSDLSGNPPFVELIKRVKEVALGAYAHQDLPFEKIVDAVQPERDMSHSPLFQVMFAMQSSASTEMHMPSGSDLQLSPIQAHSKTSKFDLTLFMLDDEDRLGGALEFNTDLYDRSTIERLIGYFQTLIKKLVQNPATRIGQISLLSSIEKEQLLNSWNGQIKKESFTGSIINIFEEQVHKNETVTAILFQENSLSYSDLNKKANQIAHLLHEQNIKLDDLVGICLPPSFDMIASILGIMKAGAAYVPIDPAHPQDRIDFIVADSGVKSILTSAETDFLFSDFDITKINLDTEKAIDQQSIKNQGIELQSDNLAYMIYTSGSTGKPKGTLITHHGLTHYLNWTRAAYPLDLGNGSLLHSTLAFDATVTSLFTPFLNGKMLTILHDNQDLEALSRALISTEKFSVLKITPAHLDMLSTQIPPARAAELTQAFIIGGENLTADQIQFWQEHAPDTLLFNEYGPTETVVGCVVYEAKDWTGTGSVPIGRAIQNTSVYVLDEFLQPVVIGASGELYIGGPALARGYKNRPDLTAERFIPDPFSSKAGARLYKTGDWVKYLPDGQLEFLNRLDDQVKIRGYRIELGEIETALSLHQSIDETVVLVREDKPGERRIVAYYTSSEETEPSTSTLRHFLKDQLPEYMVPSLFMQLDQFPLTANGKVNRKALPKPDFSRPELDSELVLPRTEDEKKLAQIWQELLNLEKVGIYDNFFELGGHSLIATQLISRIREAFKQELELRALFEEPTISGLLQALTKARLNTSLASAPKLIRVERPQQIPVSFAQQRLWFLDQLAPGSAFYNLPSAMRLKGSLDISVLQETLKEISHRHEILRTTFTFEDDQPIQHIDADFELEIEITDLSNLDTEARESTVSEMVTQEAREPFDLEVGPLLRVRLLHLADNDHVIMFTMHHIISDGWSINVLMAEVSALYNSINQDQPSPLAPLPVQYADFAIWQRNWLSDVVLESQINYWKNQIGLNPSVLQLPIDKPRPAVQTFNGDVFSGEVPPKLTTGIKEIAQREQATLFMTLLAAFQTLLYRYSAQTEFLVGSPIAGRNHLETEKLIGFFVNTLVLKADFSDNPDFTTYLHQTKVTTLGAYSNQDLPFEQLVEILQPERDMSHSPLFQVMFVLQNTPLPKGTLSADLQMEALEAKDKTAKFDLSFVVIEDRDHLQCELEFNTDLFLPSSIERLFNHFKTLIKQIIDQPQLALSELTLLDSVEQEQMAEKWNQNKVEFEDQLMIQQIFEQAVEENPQAIALVFENEELTFEQLNSRANQLAHYLRAQGTGSETVVGISLNRTPDLVIGMLGILKAGGVYLPIDPTYPEDRIRFILNDSKVQQLLSTSDIDLTIIPNHIRVTELDSSREKIRSFSKENLEPINDPENLAYIIYTSGSTGRPKGAMLQHQGLVNLTSALSEAYQVQPGRRCLQFASFSFDASVEEIFTALTNGATLHLIPKEKLLSGTGLIETLKTQKISNVTLPPSVLSLLEPHDFPELQTVVSAGEACSRELTEKWAPGRHFVNGYGPTENTVCSTVYALDSGVFGSTVPIGKPLQNIQTYILDSQLNALPIGVPGELHLAGPGLARGYLNRPDLSAEKFLPNPFSDNPGQRMYRTGDLARYLSDGNIEFLGRIDQQVKVRGYRIELGEVEAAISEQTGIQDVVVIANKVSETDHRLIAYFIAQENKKISHETMKKNLTKLLPDYMIPVAFIPLDMFPLTVNGKIDFRTLPEPEMAEAERKQTFVKPTNTTEARLCAIWEKLLNTSPIGIDDNFFEQGGHSLLAMRLLTQIEEQFGKDIQLVSLFQNPTVRHLAKVLTEESDSETTAKLISMNDGQSGKHFYFVHPSGGSVHHYAELAKQLDPQTRVFGIQAKGMDSKEEIHTTIEAMASTYVELILEHQKKGPYYLASYSFGVVVIHEMARQLLAMRHKIGLLAQLDQGPEIDDDLYADDAEMLSKLFKRYFKLDPELLRSFDKEEMFKFVFKKAKKAKIIPRFIRLKEFSHYIRINQSQTQAWLRYQMQPIKQDMSLFRSEENKDADPADLGWAKFIDGNISIIDVPGDHLSMLKEPQVRELAVKLNLFLE